MALHLIVSNSLEVLANRLCNDLRDQRPEVFQPIYIITQTDGMNTWLKHQVAYNNGIAANYRYLKAQELINQVYYLLGGRSSEMLSAENLSWVVYKLLGNDDFISRYPDVAGYYLTDTPDREVKKMGLAEKVADLFDQYQIYRPEMMTTWSEEGTSTASDWHQYLWQQAKALLADKLPDKTHVSRFILDELIKPEQREKLQLRMPVVYLFGLSITTNYHLQLYHALGNCIDLKFHFINPAPGQYWFEDINPKQLAVLKRNGFADTHDEPTGNTLLTSWGKVLQDTYGLLFQHDELLNAYEEAGEWTWPENMSLLQKIQHDVFTNSTTTATITTADCTDGSITINTCYSAAREVEVLYDYLVHLSLQKQGNLSPRDIVVMVSDINTYTPFIKAVFDNAPYRFRYSITDDSYITGDTTTAALKLLLSLTEESFSAENIVQLLDSSFIRKRFGISEIALIRQVVNEANIRFGIDNTLHDESIYVSWRYGLKRIMFGICMGESQEFGEGAESFYPLDVVEGNASAQLVRFTHFVEVLIDAVRERTESRTIKEWVDFVQRVLDNMICEPEISTDEDYLLLIKQLGAYNVLNEYFNEKVSYRVFSHSFLKVLQTSTTNGSFASAGITFCSLIPMRSIPFGVVAMLGLNFDKFPRKENTVSFNHMEKQKRRGDRNVKENDKHLFLETLLSAQSRFYVSYVGQSARDNTSVPPSALVDELLDYIQAGASEVEEVRKLLVKKHPLHGFSSRYNREGSGLVTYLNTKPATEPDLVDATKNQELVAFSEVSMDAFINFFKNAFKGYYNNVLKIYYREEEVLLEESELFELNGLQKWSLKNELLTIEPGEYVQLRDKLVKTGQLPLKNMATVVLNATDAAIADTRVLFNDCTKGVEPQPVPLEVVVQQTTLSGTLRQVYGNNLVVVSFSGGECKYLLEAYLKYLLATAAGLQLQLYFISAKKNKTYKGVSLNRQEALERLEALLELYKTGHETILAFYPAFKIKPKDLDDLDEESFQKAIKQELENYNYACTDQYILSEYRSGYYNREDVLDWYKANGQLLLKPLAELFPEYYD